MNDLLKTVAPTLATAFGSPLAGVAVSFLADKLGLSDKSIKAVSDAMGTGMMTPDQIAQIKLAEIEFKKFLQTNQIDLERISAADRDSARNMQIATRSLMPAALTILITIGFFSVLGAMFKWPEVKESAPLMIMLGSLGTAWTGCCAFWFGTTHNSQQKTEMLAQSTLTAKG